MDGDSVKHLACDTATCGQLCEHPQVICLAKSDSILYADAQQVAEIFKILGDVTRVRILQALSKRALCVCDIAAVIEMGQSAVSHQLRILRGAHLVKYHKEGKSVVYSLDDEHITSLLLQGIAHVKHR
jgi:DNA-binding transcriptional ArsR family regulator